MNISKLLEEGRIVLALDGRLDTASAPRLQEVLIPAFDEAGDVTLDFADLAYVSSAGLRVLLTGLKTAKARGASMTVRKVSDEIMEVLEMTGFADMLAFE